MLNALEYATVFQQSLDGQIITEATSGWMEKNAGQVKYNGGAEIKVPKIVMSGLGDYSRDEGFTQGSVNLTYQTLTMTQDRGRTFQLDAGDVDETNFALSAANIMSYFQKTQVIPEIDSYRYSKLFSIANDAERITEYSPAATTVLETLKNDIANVLDEIGDVNDLVITMSVPCASVLEQADKIAKNLSVSDFFRGNVSTTVLSVDGIPIVKARSSLMKSAYDFRDGKTTGQTAGGIAPAAGAKQINWIITAKNVPVAVSKTDVIRVFDPATNQKANAWKIDYRKYHDLWVLEELIGGIWVNVSPVV
jgi:hypothetical protein